MFASYFTNSPELKLRYDQLGIQVEHWKGQHRAGDVHLGYERRSDGYAFSDSRYGEVEHYVIDGLAADIYALCDRDSIGLDALARDLGLAAPEERQTLMSGIERLNARRLLWTEDESGVRARDPHVDRGSARAQRLETKLARVEVTPWGKSGAR